MSVATIGDNTAVSSGTVISGSGSANTKTGYTALTASSSQAADAIIVDARVASQNGDALIDIATGGAGSETVIISNIMGSRQVADNVNQRIYVLPVAIASGTRISARFQAQNGSAALVICAYLLLKDTVGFHDCTATHSYGQATADSGAVSVDPGGSTNTKGSYSQLTASTNEDNQWVTVLFGNQNNSARTDAAWLVDIATGAAASESVVISNIAISAQVVSNSVMPMSIGPFPVAIASGTRIAARAQCTISDATDRLVDVAVILHSGTASGGGASPSFSAYIA